MGGHALYLRSRTDGKSSQAENGPSSWTSNVKVQTNDDAENVASRTDEIDQRPIWTQHPSENERMACGSGDLANDKESNEEKRKRQDEELLRTLRLETDLGRYQTFVINAGKVGIIPSTLGFGVAFPLYLAHARLARRTRKRFDQIEIETIEGQ